MTDMVTLYGSSDDLIEVEGVMREEWWAKDEDYGDLVFLSCGAVLRIRFTDEGVWRIEVITTPDGVTVTVDTAPADDDDNYSDRATVTAESITWVAVNNQIVFTSGRVVGPS